MPELTPTQIKTIRRLWCRPHAEGKGFVKAFMKYHENQHPEVVQKLAEKKNMKLDEYKKCDDFKYFGAELMMMTTLYILSQGDIFYSELAEREDEYHRNSWNMTEEEAEKVDIDMVEFMVKRYKLSKDEKQLWEYFLGICDSKEGRIDAQRR